MQEIQRADGTFERKFFLAPDDTALRLQMRREYDKAMKERNDVAEVESIRQAVLDPNSRCPCGSGKLTKNCCVKRLQSYVKTQEYFAGH